MKRYDSGQTKQLLARIEHELARQDAELRDALRDAEIAPERFRNLLAFPATKTEAFRWRFATRA